MSAKVQRPPLDETVSVESGGLALSQGTENLLALADLPVGARLILRCRKDWRDATVAAITHEAVTLSVGSPSGHTYRVRRPADSLLSLDGSIPVLGEGIWRAGRVRYDLRW
ncbi:MAG TPA: hypothetical protein VEV81_14505 [Pyrinomonadaceae bacterium]|nr:hypothetical protein [Pyrinomonadaceae bacterium]